MSFSRNTRRLTAVAGAVAVLAAAGCSSSADEATGSNGATVDRAATGELSSNGGARRIDGDQSAAVRDAVNASGAKNVILLIGDGMGDSEITAARNYAEGAAGSFPGLDALPITGQYTHYALTKDGKPDYVTDSAASGSAWSTGTKTYNGAISVDIKGQAQSTVLEIAKANGKATGNVSTAEVQDATPRSAGRARQWPQVLRTGGNVQVLPGERPRERRQRVDQRTTPRHPRRRHLRRRRQVLR